jgi:hypothetical protein
MLLNLHLRDRLEHNIFNMTFLGDHPDGVPIVRRRCMNFGEVISVFPGHKRTPSRIGEHFRSILALLQNPSSGLHIGMMTPILKPRSASMTFTRMMKTGLLL